ncbi:MAG: IclR family transcriptional regulator [Pseudonocardia sp.]|nr:IclR family transcriptional regulator [Pseudonocardia sp.]
MKRRGDEIGDSAGAAGAPARPARPRRTHAGRSSDSGNAVSKAVRVLEEAVRTGGPRQLADIAADAGVLKPSTHRILATLVELGYVASLGGGIYTAGPRIRALAAGVDGSATGDVAAELAALRRSVGQTVHLALRSGDQAVYTHKVEADQPYTMTSRVGMRLALHCTAIGKAILAHLPDDELTRIVKGTRLPPRTPNTHTDPASLRADLSEVRRLGYALDDEENESTVRCLGAAVLDGEGNPLGAVSISTVVFLVPTEQLLGFAPMLIETAKRIGPLLG